MASHAESILTGVDGKVCALLSEEEGETRHQRNVTTVQLPDSVLALLTSQAPIDGLDGLHGPDDERRAGIKDCKAPAFKDVIANEQTLHLHHPIIVLDGTEPGDTAGEEMLVVAADDELAAVVGLLVAEPEGEHVLIQDTEFDQVKDRRDAGFAECRVAHAEDTIPRASGKGSSIQDQRLTKRLISNLIPS